MKLVECVTTRSLPTLNGLRLYRQVYAVNMLNNTRLFCNVIQICHGLTACCVCWSTRIHGQHGQIPCARYSSGSGTAACTYALSLVASQMAYS